MKLLHGDCLELMRDIPDGSIDMILCDMPYGTTACAWDKRLDLDAVWQQYRRIIKPVGAICLFGEEPFSTMLRSGALDLYKYDWYWEKSHSTGFFDAKNRPMTKVELISVFSKGVYTHVGKSKRRMTYNPQGLKKKETPYLYRRNRRRQMGGVRIPWRSIMKTTTRYTKTTRRTS